MLHALRHMRKYLGVGERCERQVASQSSLPAARNRSKIAVAEGFLPVAHVRQE